jgi:hypothetical protein
MPLVLDDFLPRPVLVATLVVAFLSLMIDLTQSDIEPEPVDFRYALRTTQQQARYEAHVGDILRSDSGSGVFSRLGEVLLEDQALAPEDLAVSADGVAFTGLIDGRILALTPSGDVKQPLSLRNFTRTGQDLPDCGSPELEPACGRPLGLLFAPSAPFAKFLKRIPSPELFAGDQVLLVADAYKGLLLVDATGRKTLLFNHVVDPATGERQRVDFMNGVAFARDASAVFVTESSRRFSRNQVVLEYLERRPTGRLLRLDLATGRVRIVADELAFPNGLAMLADANGKDEALIIALTTRNKLVKYSLKTEQIEDFAFLPSEPDNVAVEVVNSKPSIVVGLATPSTGVVGYLKTRVKTRKLLSLLPSWITVSLVKRSGSFAVLDAESGDVRRVYEDSTGKKAFLVSGAKRFGDHFYLLSWFRRALVRIPAAALEEA